jgi:hypothetical protein
MLDELEFDDCDVPDLDEFYDDDGEIDEDVAEIMKMADDSADSTDGLNLDEFEDEDEKDENEEDFESL